MRSAFFIAAASIFASQASAASPSDQITSASYPTWVSAQAVAGFTVDVKIIVKKGYVNYEDTGRADFDISVTFPVTPAGTGGQTVVAKCEDEEFIFEEGAMMMSPFDDETCTGQFVIDMNTAFIANGVKRAPVASPITLPFDPRANTLVFNAIGGANFIIPAGKPVKRSEVRLL